MILVLAIIVFFSFSPCKKNYLVLVLAISKIVVFSPDTMCGPIRSCHVAPRGLIR
jgi:hypothetical protein